MTPTIFNNELKSVGAKLTPVPIYDDPNHPHYGPVRRMHLILLYLFGDVLPQVERRFGSFHDLPWDRYFIREYETWGEGEAAQGVLALILDCWNG